MHDSTKVMSTRISMLYSVRLADRFFLFKSYMSSFFIVT